MFAKSNRYYYNQRAIAEPSKTDPLQHPLGAYRGIGAHLQSPASVSRLHPYRNKRSIWTISRQLFPDTHFAVFPEKLIEPMVLAGSRKGDFVLDPFMGSGTTALVAKKHNRRYIGIELNAEYVRMAEKRMTAITASSD
jgi:DNA modification methylase